MISEIVNMPVHQVLFDAAIGCWLGAGVLYMIWRVRSPKETVPR